MNIKLLFLIGIVAFSTTCPKFRPAVDFKNPGTFISRLNEYIRQAQNNYECYRYGPTHIDAQGRSCAGTLVRAFTELQKEEFTTEVDVNSRIAIHQTQPKPFVCRAEL